MSRAAAIIEKLLAGDTRELKAALSEALEYLTGIGEEDAPVGYKLKKKWERLLGIF